MTKWCYQLGKDEIGPISNFDLLQLVEQGVIEPGTRIRKDDAQWVNASAVSGLFEALEVEAAQTELDDHNIRTALHKVSY